MPLNIFYFPPPSASQNFLLAFFFMHRPGNTVQILSEEEVCSPSTYTPIVKSFRRRIKEVGKRKVNVPSLDFSEKNLCLTPGEGSGLWIIWEGRCPLAAQNMVPVSYRERGFKTFNFLIFSSWHSLLANLGRILTTCRQTAVKSVLTWIPQGDPWQSGPYIITLKHLELWLCW